MKKILSLIFSSIVLSCSTDNEENQEAVNGNDPIIGSWTIIESGSQLVGEEPTSRDFPCSSTQKMMFYEDGLMDSEMWGGDGEGNCEYDLTRQGDWLKTTRSDFPNANYRLIYYEIPRIDDEEIGYPNITFSSNTMRIEYSDFGEDSIWVYTYRTFQRD